MMRRASWHQLRPHLRPNAPWATRARLDVPSLGHSGGQVFGLLFRSFLATDYRVVEDSYLLLDHNRFLGGFRCLASPIGAAFRVSLDLYALVSHHFIPSLFHIESN